jgi:hypothetical protein
VSLFQKIAIWQVMNSSFLKDMSEFSSFLLMGIKMAKCVQIKGEKSEEESVHDICTCDDYGATLNSE